MVNLIGLLAGLFVVLAFYTTAPRWLRAFAITSNLLFLLYGWTVGLWPIVLLHAILLPHNAMRLLEIGQPPADQRQQDLSNFERDAVAREVRFAMLYSRRRAI